MTSETVASNSKTAVNNFSHPFSHFRLICTVLPSPRIVYLCVYVCMCTCAHMLTSPSRKRLPMCVLLRSLYTRG